MVARLKATMASQSEGVRHTKGGKVLKKPKKDPKQEQQVEEEEEEDLKDLLEEADKDKLKRK